MLVVGPAMLLFAGVEFGLRRSVAASDEPRTTFAEARLAVATGLFDQLVNIPTALLFVATYKTLGAFAPQWFHAPSVLAWVALVLAVDFSYYWFHRVSHRVNLFWAAHEVHHQARRFDLTVSFRQGAFATPVVYAFYLPLAVVGFPVGAFAIVHTGYQVYQFFAHARSCPRAKWLEVVFVTPALHRVHHGRSEACIDRNFGGLLSVWDRAFGTFAPAHVDTGEYGVDGARPPRSPLSANLSPYVRLFQQAARARSPHKVTKWLFARPASAPPVDAPELTT